MKAACPVPDSYGPATPKRPAMKSVPLTLYVHVPWCRSKCPYCDFNSHPLRGNLDEPGYIEALLRDLSLEIHLAQDRPLESIFIGGGTPSLLSGRGIERLLQGIRQSLVWRDEIEITLEANPGTFEMERFAQYREAGVNRLSLGIQSFDDASLGRLGRIHSAAEAMNAVRHARAIGFDNLNLDLMYGLPRQRLQQARADLQRAIELEPSHLSYYQLTIETGTVFARTPPPLPSEEDGWQMQEQGQALLDGSSYRQYEVSAFARDGYECVHNRNYWQFGDYLGIGAGAHAKISFPDKNSVQRRWKIEHPERYLAGVATARPVAGESEPDAGDLLFEFMLNALRLVSGVPRDLFTERTGLPLSLLTPRLESAIERGLLAAQPDRWLPTPLGWRFLNDLVGLFLP